MINIILAEDHTVVRNGIRSLLEKVSDYKIIGEAESGEEVLSLLDQGAEPDILLCDLNLKGMGGMDLTTKLVERGATFRIIILTMLDKENFVVKAFNAGASGYLLKTITPDEMIFAIRYVYLYGRYVCSELSLRFLERLIALPVITDKAFDITGVKFTDRDLEVLELIADGYTNEQIAEKLFTGKRTAEAYRKALLEKTDTTNTAALIRFAMRNKLIS
jgi:DNA-binding NarL/FixJ family response regulator